MTRGSADGPPVLALAPAALVAPAAEAGDPPTCDGLAATIVGDRDGQPRSKPLAIRGTDGDDVIVGTDGYDHISAGNGNDTVCALGGKGTDATMRSHGCETRRSIERRG